MLVDAGPLIALCDEDDKNHTFCVAALHRLPYAPLVITWACLTEAMYLLHSLGGYRYQERLWRLLRAERLLLLEVTITELQRVDALMALYQDVPMDMADASLIAIAESRGYQKVFTIDRDFYIYRLQDGSMLEVIR